MKEVSLNQRKSAIIRAIHVRGVCSLSELARQLEVSQETVRRDVRELEEQGTVEKLHGKVKFPDNSTEAPLHRRMAENMEIKQRIGEAAASLINSGETVILDPGSTTCYVARALCERAQLQVLTNSTEIANTFMPNPQIKTYLAGGEMFHDDSAAFGPTMLEFFGAMSADTLILSVGAINARFGLMDYKLQHIEYSQLVMSRADRTIVVADSSKFGRRGLATISALDAVDFLVTDTLPPPPFDQMLKDSDVQVVIA